MECELFPDGGGPTSVGFDRFDAGGRWRNFDAKNAFHDPCTAQDGRSGGAVGRDREHAGLGKQSATRRVGREGRALQFDTVGRGQAVVPR